jgi:small GTP-binding protein
MNIQNLERGEIPLRSNLIVKKKIESIEKEETNTIRDNDTTRKFNYKITVVGDGRVGKTSLIEKFTRGSFKKEYIKTLGAQFSLYDKKINNDKIRLMFWDIAGQDKFYFLRPSFFNNTKAAIIVYSLEENKLGRESFNHITYWFNIIIKHCKNIPIIVFANKVDLVDDSKIDFSSIQNIVNKNGLLRYYLTSAETGIGVTDAFNIIIDAIYYTRENKQNLK